MSIKSLLEMPSNEIKGAKEFPAGQYKVQIIRPEVLPFQWKKSGKRGRSYCPEFQIIEPVLSGDPDLDNELQAQLDDFGDYSSKKFQFFIPEKKEENRPKSAGIAACNFTLVNCNADWEDVALDEQAWRFYCPAESSKTGVEQGFAVDVLGISGTGKNIRQIIDETEGRFMIVELKYDTPEPGSQYAPRLQCVSVSAA